MEKEYGSKLDIAVRQRMKHLWVDKKFCDFTINVEDVKFQTHKILLASCSEYFRGMFDHATLETAQNEVTLQDISPLAMEKILNFWYGFDLALDDDNVNEILFAANRMQSREIEDYCVNYLKDGIDSNNCLEYFVVASQSNNNDLYDLSLDFCLDNFDKLIEQEDFLHLNVQDLIKLISSNLLNVDREETVFNAIIKWISYDQTNRSSYIGDLMSHVRFTILEPDIIKAWVKDKDHKYEIFNRSLQCRDHLVNALLFRLQQHNSELYPYRTPLRNQQRIYAVGGWPNGYQPTNTIECYNRHTNKWQALEPMRKSRCGVGIAILNNSIYAIGGHDGQEYLKDVERFNLSNNKWYKDVADMSNGRNSLGAVALDGYIYAMGGQSGTTSLNIVEKYDPKCNTWSMFTPMLERRLGLGVAVLNRLIYALGGADAEVSNTVEYFDPKLNKWCYVSPMLTERKHFGCTSFEGKIYAVGGRGTELSHELKTAECYNPVTNKWERIASMTRYRSGIGLVTLDGLLYAIGGHNGDKKLNDVEIYDPRENKWTDLENPMLYERLGAGVVVQNYTDICRPNIE